MPGLNERIQPTTERLLIRLDELQAELAANSEHRLATERHRAARFDPLRNYSAAPRQDTCVEYIAPSKATPLPAWASWKRDMTSFHAFQLRDDENFWVVINSATHYGYFIVPAPLAFDGWDEALPASLGRPDLTRGAYVGDGPMDRADAWFYAGRSSASRIDSDASLIAGFVGC